MLSFVTTAEGKVIQTESPFMHLGNGAHNTTLAEWAAYCEQQLMDSVDLAAKRAEMKQAANTDYGSQLLIVSNECSREVL